MFLFNVWQYLHILIFFSAFQSLSSTSCDIVIQELTNQLRLYYKQCLDKTDTDLRKYIDIIGGLMDNFPLGNNYIVRINKELNFKREKLLVTIGCCLSSINE